MSNIDKNFEDYFDTLIDEIFKQSSEHNNNVLEDKEGNIYIELFCPGAVKESINIEQIKDGIKVKYDEIAAKIDEKKELTEQTNTIEKIVKSKIFNPFFTTNSLAIIKLPYPFN